MTKPIEMLIRECEESPNLNIIISQYNVTLQPRNLDGEWLITDLHDNIQNDWYPGLYSRLTGGNGFTFELVVYDVDKCMRDCFLEQHNKSSPYED